MTSTPKKPSLSRPAKTIESIYQTLLQVYDQLSPTMSAEPKRNALAGSGVKPDVTSIITDESVILVLGNGTLEIRAVANIGGILDLPPDTVELLEFQYRLNGTANPWVWAPHHAATDATVVLGQLNAAMGTTQEFRFRYRYYVGGNSDWVLATAYISGTEAPPPDITGLTAAVYEFGVKVSWIPVAVLDLDKYEVQKGTVWNAPGNTIWQTKNAFLDTTERTAGLHSFMVKAIDRHTTPNYSAGVPTIATATVNPPTITGLPTATYLARAIQVAWVPVQGSFPIDHYEVRRGGTSWANATELGNVQTPTITDNWIANADSQIYRVKAVDVAGNASAEASQTFTVLKPTVTEISAVYSGRSVNLGWVGNVLGFDIYSYKVRRGVVGGTWETSVDVGTVQTPGISEAWNPAFPATVRYFIKAYDAAGSESTVAGSYDAAPSVPTLNAPIASFSGQDLVISWGGNSGAFLIDYYDVYRGTTAIAKTGANSVREKWDTAWPAAMPTWYVTAYDVAGRTAGPVQITPVFTAPNADTFTVGSPLGRDVLLSWNPIPGSFEIIEYEVWDGGAYFGDPAGYSMGKVKTTSMTHQVDWVGVQKFWLKVYDIAGNSYALPTGTEYTVTPPEILSSAISAEIIDNNALLRWSYIKKTLDVYRSLIEYAGPYTTPALVDAATKASAVQFGFATTTFMPVFLSKSGYYKFWITPYDVADNAGVWGVKTAKIDQPPDFVLRDQWDTDWYGASSNVAVAYAGRKELSLESRTTYMEAPAPVGWDKNAWTVEFEWILNETPIATYLFGKSSDSISDLHINTNTDGRIAVHVLDTSGVDNYAIWVPPVPSVEYMLGIRRHIAVTFDGTYIRIYIDGVLGATSAAFGATPPRDNGTPIRLNAVNNLTVGTLATYNEFRVWNVVRTQPQINASKFQRIDPSTPGLIGCYRMDELDGVQVWDYSPNHNHGILSGTYTWLAPANNDAMAPFDTGLTFAQWVTNIAAEPSVGKTYATVTMAHVLAGGWSYAAHPVNSVGVYEATYDAGVTVPSTRIVTTLTATPMIAGGVISIQIYTSNDLTGAWTAMEANQWDVYASTFRYVKVVLTFTTDAARKSFWFLDSLDSILRVKLRNDSGMYTVLDAVNTPTTDVVPFTIEPGFIDITAINVTPMGTAARSASVDFVDVPDPVNFKIYLHDAAGVRQTGLVSWTARGY